MNAFLKGFAKQAELPPEEADEQWAAFSRQLPDSERQRIEARGYFSGVAEGKKFRAQFPKQEEDQ